MSNTGYSCLILIAFEISRQIFVKYSKKNLMKIRPVVVVPCGRTDGQTNRHTNRQTDRQRDRKTDMEKLIVSFRSLANAPKYFS